MTKATNLTSMLQNRARIDDNEIPKRHPLADNRTRHDDASLPHRLREPEGMAGQKGHVLLIPVFLIDPLARLVVPDSDEKLRRGATVQDAFF